EEVPAAHGALAAGDREGDYDPVAGLDALHPRARLDDLAHELVPEDVAALHGRHEAVVQMEIGAADRGGCDPDDRVPRVEDLGIGDVLDLDRPLAFPAGRFHRASPCLCV